MTKNASRDAVLTASATIRPSVLLEATLATIVPIMTLALPSVVKENTSTIHSKNCGPIPERALIRKVVDLTGLRGNSATQLKDLAVTKVFVASEISV